MTFSVLAFDRESGVAAAAVASHFPGVGAVVPWVSADGGVLTQAVGDPEIGRHGLALLADGFPAEEVLARIVGHAGQPSLRQVAVVDARGGAAAHTGSSCMQVAGDVTCGDGRVAAVALGNICRSAHTWHATAARLLAEVAAGTALPEAAVAGLQAGHADGGGDVRGQLAAALNVHEPSRPVWHVRADADPQAVATLAHLIGNARAYHAVGDAAGLLSAGTGAAEAVELLQGAVARVPGNAEVRAYLAAALAADGRPDAARQQLLRCGPVGAELLRRVADSGWFGVDAQLLVA